LALSVAGVARLLNQRRAIDLLQKHGWTLDRGGKHAVKMVKEGWAPVALPRHHGGDYSKRLTHKICKEAGIEPREGRWISPSASMRNQMASGQRSRSSPDASRQAEL
jgi:predicted RNA binding protein YcfA (HicA-like mRNA interferase family)